MARPYKKIQLIALLPSLTAGLISGILVIILQISFATLIFSHELAGQLSHGIGLTLFGAFVIGTVMALTSSFPGVICCLQGSPAVVLALMAGTIAGSMPVSATAENTLITVTAAIGLASFFSGAFFWALGRFKLGSLIRFVPYPVIGGFLAGTGLVMFVKAMGVMTGSPLSLSQLSHLMQSKIMIKWIPGAIFAVILLYMERRHRHYAIMPTVILFSIAAFYLFLVVSRTTIPEARNLGLLLEPLQSGVLWSPFSISVLHEVNWHVVAANVGQMGTIFIISLISLLLNASGLELAVRRDIDLNRELRSAGFANILSGLFTSPVGYHTLSLSVLIKKMGSHGRFAAIISAALCAATLFFGGSFLSLLPKFILGGLLLFLGLSFLIEWLYDGWFKIPVADYFIVVLILLIIGFRGFLDGVGVGLIIAVVLFVIKYSSIDVVKQTLTGANSKSNVDRPVEHRRVLRKRGEELLLLRLQGYIFFGTAHNLYRKVRKRSEDPALPDLRFVLLDFTRVSGLDSSAEVCFMKMMDLGQSEDIKIIISNIAPALRHQLEKSVFIKENRSIFLIFPDEDHGVEWCENHFLAEENMLTEDDKLPLSKYLEEAFPNEKHIKKIMGYLKREELEEGYPLMRQGEESDGLYFIETGQAIAQIYRNGTTGAETERQKSQPKASIRLRVMRPGTVVGEVSMYLGVPRTATVIIGKPSILYHLSSEALQQMEERDPDLAAALHHFIARLLAERLSDNTRTIQALGD